MIKPLQKHGMKRFDYSLTGFALAAVFAGTLLAFSTFAAEASKIYWSDADSGRLDGVKFRIANKAAPETGSFSCNIICIMLFDKSLKRAPVYGTKLA